MDEMVLEAQQWVNATYAGVSGYVAAPENGKVGWSTMYSLTRALQHELGLTALSDNFGSGTLSALTAHGSIGPSETNTNIVKIVQCGCYCKGYQPGGITGTYSINTRAGIVSLMNNAGLGAVTDGTLPPKVFKALLTMDAYVLLAGGSRATSKSRVRGTISVFVLVTAGVGVTWWDWSGFLITVGSRGGLCSTPATRPR